MSTETDTEDRIRNHTVTLVLDTAWTEVFARITCQAGPDAACQVDGKCDAADFIIDDSIPAYSGPGVELKSGVEAEVWQETSDRYGEDVWRWAYVDPRPLTVDELDA